MNTLFKQFANLLRILPVNLVAALGSLALLCVVQPGFAETLGDNEYALIGYSGPATHNRVATLNDKLVRGEVKLEYREGRGYLDSLLAALDIDPHSQTLVFSKTSLQYPLIDGDKPRAVYFNDDTYIGWVQNSTIVEVMTMDDRIGAVFYIFNNARETAAVNMLDRQNQRCLTCHDSNGNSGSGGIPMVLAQSSIYGMDDSLIEEVSGNENITDKTPLDKRWGGWYVTGSSGKQKHIGNVRLQGREELPKFERLLRTNVSVLQGAGLPDMTPYATGTSDIVALMLLEHQLTVQNQLTYVRFKGPAVLARNKQPIPDPSLRWAELPPRTQQLMTRMLNELVKLLLFNDAAPFADTIKGSPEFLARFEARGVADGKGRSLRQLDLRQRLVRYPLSYLIYTPYFESLPVYAKDYIYRQLAAILEGRNDDDTFKYLRKDERRDILAILRATKADFAPYLGSRD